MLSASIDAVVQALQLRDPPTVWRAVGYAVAVTVVSFPLNVVWGGICSRVMPRTFRLDLPGFSLFRATHPSQRLIPILPTATNIQYPHPIRGVGRLDDLAGHWDVYGFIAIDSASEELVFRGVPFVAAVWLGYYPLGAVLVGTLLWASLHSVRNMPAILLSGLLYAWLWLSGAWYLAIAVHVAGNGLVHSFLRVQCWRRRGRYPHPDEVGT